MRTCPYCGQTIDGESIKCQHCGSVLTSPVQTKQPVSPQGRQSTVEPSGYEPFHWKKALAAGVCLLIGIILLGQASSPAIGTDAGLYVLLGLAAIGVAVTGTVITSFWRQMDNLPPGRKIVAWVPVVIGGAAAALIVVVLWIAAAALGSSLADMGKSAASAQRQTDVQRGVEEALKKRGF